MNFFAKSVGMAVMMLAWFVIPTHAQQGPAFHLSFDEQSADAQRDGLGIQKPLVQNNLRFVEGLSGKAVYFGKQKDGKKRAGAMLKYSAGNLFSSDSGTVSFWVRPDWDGIVPRGTQMDRDYRFFSAFSRSKTEGKETPKRKIWLWMWHWLRCDLASADEKPSPNLQWKCRNTWMKGDWWHVALSWDQSDGRKLYLNGIPVYRSGQVALDDISEFFIGGETPTQRVESAIDEFKIFSRCLTRSEIEAQFREFAPLDITLERRFLRAKSKEQLSIEISAPKSQAIQAGLSLKVIADAGNETIIAWAEEISLEAGRTIQLPLSDLAVGNYRLQSVLKTEQGTWQRSFPLTVYEQREPPITSSQSLEVGECLVDIDLTEKKNHFRQSTPSRVKTVPGVGRYLELGDKKWDRIAVELPELNAPRSPLVVEVEWPDDKERAMSFYLLVASEKKQHRDRLSGGVQCGGEYINSGKMRKTRYLFYPEAQHYLFEVRTLIDRLPAAVSKLKIYTLAKRLPKLHVEFPANLPKRNLGHLDEDQSFEVLMPPGSPSPLRYGYAVQVMENLLDHNDYSGQNTISYPVLRYYWGHLDAAPVNNVGHGMRVAGWINLLLDMMEKRHQSFFAAINLYTVAEKFDQSPTQQETLIKQGHFLYDNQGKLVMYRSARSYGNNPVHPAVREKFLAQVDEIVKRFGHHPAFKGIDLWLNTPAFFTSLKQGYGDYTIAVFEKETGIKIPVSSESKNRFEQRYRFLTGPGKKDWLAWRAQKNLELVKEINTRLQRSKKGTRLYLELKMNWHFDRYSKEKTIEQFDLASYCYENYSLDVEAINAIEWVSIASTKDATMSRSDKHWNHGAHNLNYELVTNTDLFRPFRNGGRGVSSIYYRYFESFMDSMMPEKYASYFQNSDPKAAGRDFLADFAIAMAAQNPETIFAGAQPLGTMGREEVSREFARNFLSLPAGSFEDVPSMKDPVTARFLQTENGTYFYQVNLLPFTVQTILEFPESMTTVRDLGEGSTINLKQGKLEQELKPFQLKSYLVKDQQTKPGKGVVKLSRESRKWFADRRKSISELITYIESRDGEFELGKEMQQKIATQVEAGHFADAYRRINSRAIRVLPQLAREAIQTKEWFRDDFENEKQSQANWKLPAGFNLIEDGTLTVGINGSRGIELRKNPKGEMMVEATLFATKNGEGWGGLMFRGVKFLLRKDGIWVIYKVKGDKKLKGPLFKTEIKPGKEYHFKMLNKGNMYIIYVNGEKMLAIEEAKGLQESNQGFILTSSGFPVTFKNVKLSRIVTEK